MQVKMVSLVSIIHSYTYIQLEAIAIVYSVFTLIYMQLYVCIYVQLSTYPCSLSNCIIETCMVLAQKANSKLVMQLLCLTQVVKARVNVIIESLVGVCICVPTPPSIQVCPCNLNPATRGGVPPGEYAYHTLMQSAQLQLASYIWCADILGNCTFSVICSQTIVPVRFLYGGYI